MKKIKFLLASLTIICSVIAQPGQNPTSLNTNRSLGVIARSRLQTGMEGLPIELAVLRYNDSVVLAIQPSEVEASYVYFESKNHDLKFLKLHTFALYFLKNRLRPEVVIDLVSNYSFTLKDDILGKFLGQQAVERKEQKLPPYLSFSIEEIKLK